MSKRFNVTNVRNKIVNLQLIFQDMEQAEKHTQNNENSKRWLFFSVGLLAGFILSFSIYFLDKYVFNEKIHFSKTVEHIYSPLRQKPNETQEAAYTKSTDKESQTSQQVVENDTTLLADELYDEEPEEDGEADETEFESLDDDEEEVGVYADKILAQRKIRVSHADTLQQRIIEHFEVEQWSSPIKNRHAYHLRGTVLKITGLDISKVKICYIDQCYYLQYQNVFYRLQENQDFEKLVESKPKFENAE